MKNYIRKDLYRQLSGFLSGDINLIQAVVGPRQVGKTTLALQLFERFRGSKIYESADGLITPATGWINTHWQAARSRFKEQKKKTLLILDEVQKIPDWSNTVKKLFDEDRRQGSDIRIIILGSSALLMQRGLSESLAGRFEIQHHNQWSFRECHECFSVDLNEYIYFGGYPGALLLRKDEPRWGRYMRDSLIETVLSKDILLLSPVSKPALLRQTFGMAISYPAQVMSYQKMLGSLQDAGNTTTIASYLQLLSKAFLITGLERYSGTKARQRGSIPKILVFDNGLIAAMQGLTFQEVMRDKVEWGRFVENAVGAQLYFIAQQRGGELFYWRERDFEVDYVLKISGKIKAFEVKSGENTQSFAGLELFKRKYPKSEIAVISGLTDQKINGIKNINLNVFFNNPQCIL